MNGVWVKYGWSIENRKVEKSLKFGLTDGLKKASLELSLCELKIPFGDCRIFQAKLPGIPMPEYNFFLKIQKSISNDEELGVKLQYEYKTNPPEN